MIGATGPTVVSPRRAELTSEERHRILAQQVAIAVARHGARVESQTEFLVVLATGRRVNHLLHFLVGLATSAVWWIVWLVVAIAGGEKRHLMTVDSAGNVLVQHV